MHPDERFVHQPKAFWAHVRSLSQHLGYTHRKSKAQPDDGVKVPTLDECLVGLAELELKMEQIAVGTKPTALGQLLVAYFEYRADTLNNLVEPLLMNVTEARKTFERLQKAYKPKCPLPMNKQKGEKKAHAFFTGIVNMLIEKHADGLACNFDPQELTTITRDGVPVRTLARRVDGAFTSPVNPVAVWEIKEYYYTTTFGSRVADGIYESLLDGLELEELREREGINVRHYLMIDARDTWWTKGKSYLCRIIDMLHMGYVDEVLFGREVLDRLPELVPTWVDAARALSEPTLESS